MRNSIFKWFVEFCRPFDVAETVEIWTPISNAVTNHFFNRIKWPTIRNVSL